MLQNIRDNIQGTAAKVIIALIVVPFALFGIDSLFRTSSQKPAAVVNGEKISERDLAQAIAMQKRRLINMMGDRIDPGMLDEAMLRRPALDSLVKQQLLLQAAEQAKITVSSQQLNNLIAAMPQFMDDGHFSQQRYEQVLRLQGYNSGFFKQLLRSDLTIQQMSSAVSAGSFVTDAELTRAVALLHETRDFQYISIPLKPIEETVKVSEEQLVQWYEAHSQQYLSDEKVRFSYIELNESEFYEPVSEEAVEREYQSVIAANPAVTEREAAHILFERAEGESAADFEQRIDNVRKLLESGQPFGEVAKQYSSDLGSSSEGGELGFSSGDSFPSQFEKALAQLRVGEVSKPVETEAGVHLIKLLSVREPEVPTLDELREEITDRLRSQTAAPKLVAAVEELRDLVFNAENLQMPAKEMGLEIKQSDLLALGDSDGLMGFEKVKQAAFNKELRDEHLNSEVLELTDSRYLVLHIDDYKKPEVLPLEQVRDDIVQHIRREQAMKFAEEKADALVVALQRGQRAEDLAKQEGLVWQAVVDSKRSQLGVEPEILKKVFGMTRPSADSPSVATLKKGNDDWVAIVLSDVEPGEIAALNETERGEARKTLAQNSASKTFSAYFNSLWNSAEVKIN